MKILILHKVPYHFLPVHKSIDHQKNDVTYIGLKKNIETIPHELNCKKIERSGVESVSKEVLKLVSRADGFDRVVTVSEHEVLDAAIVREHLNVEGPDFMTAELWKDKTKMKAAVKKVGLFAPRFVEGNKMESQFLAGKIPWSGKTIFKPKDGSGSQGVVVFESPQAAIELAPKERSSFEFEEFVEGPIWHFDGVMEKGNIVFAMSSCYVGTTLSFNTEYKELASIQKQTPVDLNDLILPYLKAVKLNDGAFHLEMIQSERGFTFLEIGARVGGAYVRELMELKSGVDPALADIAAKAGVGLNHFHFNEDMNHCYGWLLFPGHQFPGNSKLIIEGDGFYKQNNNIPLWKIGDTAPEQASFEPGEIPWAGIIKARTSEGVLDLIHQLIDNIKVSQA